jgi:hypothetical protein
LWKAIEKNLDAALIQTKFDMDVQKEEKNGVETLKGEANLPPERTRVERISAISNEVHFL